MEMSSRRRNRVFEIERERERGDGSGDGLPCRCERERSAAMPEQLAPSLGFLVVLLICGLAAVKINAIRGIGEDVRSRQCASVTRLIIVLHGSITSQAQKAPDLFAFKVEIFQINDLLVNITMHVLRPKHRILSEGEKQVVLQRHSIEAKQLPPMLQKDVLPRYYGLEKGQVVKVAYSCELTESHVTY